MEARIAYVRVAPEGYKAMAGLEKYAAQSAIEPLLGHLVKFRVSQINECAFCLDMHSKDLRALGESEERLYALSAWRESPLYTDRERAALEWAEAVTKLDQGHVPDDLYERSRKVFGEKELVDLTWVVAAINAWNRMGISFRAAPGHYHSTLKAEAKTGVAGI